MLVMFSLDYKGLQSGMAARAIMQSFLFIRLHAALPSSRAVVWWRPVCGPAHARWPPLESLPQRTEPWTTSADAAAAGGPRIEVCVCACVCVYVGAGSCFGWCWLLGACFWSLNRRFYVAGWMPLQQSKLSATVCFAAISLQTQANCLYNNPNYGSGLLQ